MSTIASPREPVTQLRRMNTAQIGSPTSSTGRSFDIPRSSPSPIPGGAIPPDLSVSKLGKRAALREYYNIKRTGSPSGTPRLVIAETCSHGSHGSNDQSYSEIPHSELDAPGFDAREYVARAVATGGLPDLLQLYARTVGEMCALDAEKKALVYDNYSKLITATETIRRMRADMDPALGPMAGTLDLVVARVYEQASRVRNEVREAAPRPAEARNGRGDALDRRRKRTRELATELVMLLPRLRTLVGEGKWQQARREWELPRRLLERWREKKVGGDDVIAMIEEGDVIVMSPTQDETGNEACSTE